MVKRVIFTLLALGGLSLASNLPNTPPFNRQVTLDTGPAGMELESVLRSMAKSVDLPLLTKDIPKARVIFQAKRPFSQALELLVKIYAPDLDYAWLPEKVLLVAPKNLVAAAVPPSPPPTTPAKPTAATVNTPPTGEAQATASYPVPALGEEAVKLVKSLAPDVEAIYAAPAQLVVVRGNADSLASLAPLLREAEDRAQALKPKPKDEENKPQTPPENWERFDVSGTSAEEFAKAAKELGASATVALPSTGAVLVKASSEVLQQVRLALPKPVQAPPAPPSPPQNVRVVITLPSGVSSDALKALFPNLDLLSLTKDTLAVRGSPTAIEELNRFLTQLNGTVSKPETPQPALYLKGYPIYGNPAEIEAALKGVVGDQGTLAVLKEARRVVLRAPLEVHQAVVALLRQIDPPQTTDSTQNSNDKLVRSRVGLSYLKPGDLSSFLKSYGLDVEVLAEPNGAAVWIKGPEKLVQTALSLIPRLDRPAGQARMHVKMVQVSKNALSNLGAELKAALGPINLNTGQNGLGLDYLLPPNLANTLSLKLNALESSGGARTLVDSDLIAKDGTEAELRSGGSLIAQVQATPQSGSGSGGGTTPAPPQGYTNIDYGMTLTFTPKIIPGADAAVELAAKVELGDLPRPGVGNTIDVPKRSLSATYRLKSGDTALLGGLIQQNTSESKGGVPILSQIPLIGWLFSNQTSNTREDVLFIFTQVTAIDVPPTLTEVLPPPPTPVAPPAPEDTREPPVPPKSSENGKTVAEQASTPQAAASTPAKPEPLPSPPAAAAPPATPEANPAQDSKAKAPTPIANWVQATLVRTARGAALYLQSRPHSPIAKPLSVLYRDAQSQRNLPFKALAPTLTPGSALVLSLGDVGDGRLAVLLEDELGGLWQVEVQ